MACWVYVLRSEATGRYYVGSAEDVEFRLGEHNSGRVDSTKAFQPWQVIYREEHPNRAAATRREREIKGKKSRRWIEHHLLGGTLTAGSSWLERPESVREGH
jgi:putative endonuclease